MPPKRKSNKKGKGKGKGRGRGRGRGKGKGKGKQKNNKKQNQQKKNKKKVPPPKIDQIINEFNKFNFEKADKLIKIEETNHPELSLIKLFRGLWHYRNKRIREALRIYDEVATKGNLKEELVLTYLHYVYEPLKEYAKLRKAYEKAFAESNNTRHLQQIFDCYLKELNFDNLPKISDQCYKKTKNGDYLFWSPFSMLINEQTKEISEEEKKKLRKVALPRLEKILNETIQKKQLLFLSEEFVQVYLQGLIRDQQYTKALQLIEKTVPRKFKITWERDQQLLELYYLSGNYEKTIKMAQYIILIKDPDNLVAFRSLIKTVFETNKKNPIEFLMKFIKQIQKKFPKNRASLIATIETYQKKIELINAQTKEENENEKGNELEEYLNYYLESIIHYLKTWGNKICCFRDVDGYLKKDFIIQNKEFKKKFSQSIQFLNKESLFKNEEDLESIRCVKRTLGLKLKLRSGVSLIDSGLELFKEYCNDCVQFRNLESTERRPCDDLILIGSQQFLLKYIKSGYSNESDLYCSLIAMHKGLEESPYHFQFCLQLVRLYKLMGVMHHDIFEDKVEIKHIYYDSMTHVFVEDAFDLGFVKLVDDTIEGARKFHSSARVDVGSSVSNIAQQTRKYSMVAGLIEFAKKLEKSAQFESIVLIDYMKKVSQLATDLNKLKMSLFILEDVNDREKMFETSEGHFNSLSHNYDMDVLRFWGSNTDENKLLNETLYGKNNVYKNIYLKREKLILSMILEIIKLNTTKIKLIIQDLKENTLKLFLSESDDEEKKIYNESNIWKPLWQIVDLFVLIMENDKESKEENGKKITLLINNFKDSLNNIYQIIKSHLLNTDKTLNTKLLNLISTFVNKIFPIIMIILNVLHSKKLLSKISQFNEIVNLLITFWNEDFILYSETMQNKKQSQSNIANRISLLAKPIITLFDSDKVIENMSNIIYDSQNITLNYILKQTSAYALYLKKIIKQL
ncbi:n-alpha-acetyltransferase 25 natb auxiliary subunit [Anaeramoeba flamelloides]|uniref:N-alpha-acetyltransferase 25 natb auxiliary subunit n=1 Tax=Anaeramoeba flamelloides TaxID=1746091 RepID=A0AAV7YRV2_9EUKA|nr:n-alpha-acetyltransferase 25 natb auxiliary subunit [Anaeramoeba flamelloides]